MPHRFRIYHVDEDAADGSDMIVPTGYGVHHCGWCQQRQLGEVWDRCMYCNEPLSQAGWVCPCGHRNPTRATECEGCGSPLQE